MSQYSSGFPIDPDPERTAYLPPVPEAPAPGPQQGYLPPAPPAAWAPAPAPVDQTAILPPVPAQADPYAAPIPGWDAPAAPPQGTPDPLTGAQLPGPGAAAGGIPGWDAPAMPSAGDPLGSGFAAPVDPLTGAQQPLGGAPGQPAGGFATHAPQGPVPGGAEAGGGIPGWDAPAVPSAGDPLGGGFAPVDALGGAPGQPAGAGHVGQAGGFAAPAPQGPVPGGMEAVGGIPGWDAPAAAPQGAPDPLTGAQLPGPGAAAGGIPGWDGPAMPSAADPLGDGFAAPAGAGHPDRAGGFAVPAQQGEAGGIPGWDAPAVPASGTGPLTGGQLLGAPGESTAEVSFVGAGGWADAPMTYGEPASLRERFANAAPTGPAGPAGPGGQPMPRPLEAGPDGSLREAFAAAAPTGAPVAPAASFAAAPTAPAAAPTARRTGSPIIDPGVQPAALTAVLAVLLALGSLLGRPGLLVPVVALQALTAAGWFRLNGMWPARQGIALAFLGGLVADTALLAGAGTAGQAIAGALGAFFLLVLVLQIFRPSDPDERFAALTVSASATVVTVLAAGFLAAPAHADVVPGVLGAAIAAAVSAVLRSPVKLGFIAGGFVAAVIGAIVGVMGSVGAGGGLFLGLAAGLCGLLGRRVAAYDWPSRFVHMTAGVALPLALAGPAVHLVGLLLAK